MVDTYEETGRTNNAHNVHNVEEAFILIRLEINSSDGSDERNMTNGYDRRDVFHHILLFIETYVSDSSNLNYQRNSCKQSESLKRLLL